MFQFYILARYFSIKKITKNKLRNVVVKINNTLPFLKSAFTSVINYKIKKLYKKLLAFGEPAISPLFSPCLTGPVDYLFASRHKGPRFKSPEGYLCETGILLLIALSRYIGDPDVIDHPCLVQGGPRTEPSLGLRTDNVIIPLDLTQLSCSGYTLAAGLLSGFITDGVGCWGGGGGTLWRTCNLTSFSPCLAVPVDYLFASRHKGPRFKSPAGYLCETGILLLALSRYMYNKIPIAIKFYTSRKRV
jgi:hypothetical protein